MDWLTFHAGVFSSNSSLSFFLWEDLEFPCLLSALWSGDPACTTVGCQPLGDLPSRIRSLSQSLGWLPRLLY